MITINITRRKQPVGFSSRLTVTTKDGQSVSLKSGDTATLNTNGPIDEVYVKHFWQSQAVKTGITNSTANGNINLELLHDLPLPAMYIMLVVSVLLVINSLSGFSSKRYISISLFLILISLIAKTKRGAITIKPC